MTTAHAEQEHEPPAPAAYIKVGLMLFVLTALEVALYEIDLR